MAKEPSRSAKRPKLPYQLTNFIGRERELAEIAVNAKKQPEGSVQATRLMAMGNSWFEKYRGLTPMLVLSIQAKLTEAIKKNLDEESFTREYDAGKKLTQEEFLKLEAHVHSIFGKIEVNSRAEATRYAIEHGLA